MAPFGEANLNLADNFQLIAGVRAIRDDLDFVAGRVSSSLVTVTGIRPNFSAKGATTHFHYSDRLGCNTT